MRSRLTAKWPVLAVSMGIAATLAFAQPAHAATINWKGHTWNVTSGGMAGVCQGNPANISIDTSGYLHMKLSNSGGTWSAAEIFSTDRIGFGTYQWQIDGPVDRLDKNVVVGLYPYGPEAGIGSDGQNEIDIEYARWGNASYPNGNYTVYPATGTGSSEITFDFTLTGTYTTSRFTWSSTAIDFATMSGFEPLGSTAGLIKAWTFSPASSATKVPQQALPVGMNLWCYDNPPSDGQNVEIIVRDFQFVPLGTLVDGGAGGTDGAPATEAGGASESSDTSARDTLAVDALSGPDAPASKDGPAGAAGATGTGGVATGGVTGTGGAGMGGTAGTMSAGGAIGSGGAVGNGGTGAGGTNSNASVGASSPGGAAGTGGMTDSGGMSGSAGATAGAGGVVGGGGSTGIGTAAGTSKSGSGGCGCGVTGAPRAQGGRVAFLTVALLLARRHHRRRQA